MSTREMFGDLAGVVAAPVPDLGEPRFQAADRRQLRLETVDIDRLVPADHEARTIWEFLGRLDLSRFYAAIGTTEHRPGRPPPDPRIMIALWLYAYSDGVGSARQLDELCRRHDAYRWICGGVLMNYHSLADFRVAHGEALEDLMVQVLAALTSKGLVTFTRVSQDGLRVRASAGAASFRREKTIEKWLAEARQHVEEMKKQADQSDSQRSAREKAAQERAAREREERLRRAKEELEKLQAGRAERNERVGPKSAKDPKEARVSTTDPDARVMKMADGGFRPAFNIQLSTAVEGRAVVGVQVSNSGSDAGLMLPMLDHLQTTLECSPEDYLMDGGYVNGKAITAATDRGVTVYAPPKVSKQHPDPYAPSRHDTPAIQTWRARMATPQAKEIYKLRAATSETINGDLRLKRALDRLLVRGIQKVKAVVLWAVLSFNLARWASLEQCITPT